MLSALPNLFTALAQLKSPDLTEKTKSRKTIVNAFVLIQGAVLIPIVMMALVRTPWPYVFIMLVVFFTVSGSIATPAYGSLMSDLVQENMRGAYFGWRQKTLGFVTVGRPLSRAISQPDEDTGPFHGSR